MIRQEVTKNGYMFQHVPLFSMAIFEDIPGKSIMFSVAFCGEKNRCFFCGMVHANQPSNRHEDQ